MPYRDYYRRVWGESEGDFDAGGGGWIPNPRLKYGTGGLGMTEGIGVPPYPDMLRFAPA